MSANYQEVQSITPADAVSVVSPTIQSLPLLFEFPHSGYLYPKDFQPNPAVPLEIIISGADSYVDELFEGLANLGATGVRANFPRVYLDVNRHQHDLEKELVGPNWYSRSQSISTQGTGLLWTIARSPHRMYDRPLSPEEIRYRLSTCFIPYHQALTTEIERLRRWFGGVYILACHSMRSTDFNDEGRPTTRRPEIDLGHRNYQTCESSFIECIADEFSQLGYDVCHGQKYSGGENSLRYGWPHLNQHFLQIEIRRDFYMDEETRCQNENFHQVQAHCQQVSHAAAEYVRSKFHLS